MGLKVKGAQGSILVSTFSIRVKGECGLELKFKASGFVDCKHFTETCSDPPTPPRGPLQNKFRLLALLGYRILDFGLKPC